MAIKGLAKILMALRELALQIDDENMKIVMDCLQL
jgi:hypothetical protein